METQAVINLYKTRGFTVTRVEGDQEFGCIANDLLPAPLNIADADDHVAEVKRSIRTIKEPTRCLIQGLPFKRIHKPMMRAAIENAHKVLNQFPPKSGVSDTLSPLTIMTGKPSPDYNDMRIKFGAYAQVFEDNDPTNTQRHKPQGPLPSHPRVMPRVGTTSCPSSREESPPWKTWHENKSNPSLETGHPYSNGAPE
jgi:hypothetical protein